MPRMKFRPSSHLPLLVALGLVLGAWAGSVLAPGCPVREATGLKCPGCGMGRAVAAGLRGDFAGVFYWNALLLPLVGLLVAAGFRKPWRWRGWLALGAAVYAFAVLRNLPFYLLY